MVHLVLLADLVELLLTNMALLMLQADSEALPHLTNMEPPVQVALEVLRRPTNMASLVQISEM
jgi:hypothetical protein